MYIFVVFVIVFRCICLFIGIFYKRKELIIVLYVLYDNLYMEKGLE